MRGLLSSHLAEQGILLLDFLPLPGSLPMHCLNSRSLPFYGEALGRYIGNFTVPAKIIPRVATYFLGQDSLSAD